MRGLDQRFSATAASIVGREHIRLQRNNQDGVSLLVRPDLLVAAVADGCSAGRFCEVGARLAVRWFTAHAPALVERHLEPEALAEATVDGLVGYLSDVGRGLCFDEATWPETVHDFLLCTFLAVVMSAERTVVFGLGDGVVSVNGDLTVLEAGRDNAPHYPAYRLVNAAILPVTPWTAPRVHHAGTTSRIESLVIGTDGLIELEAMKGGVLKDGSFGGGLAELERDERYLRNPSLLQKRLTVLGEVNQRLRDDTSLVLVRSRTAAAQREGL